MLTKSSILQAKSRKYHIKSTQMIAEIKIIEANTMVAEVEGSIVS